MDKLAVFTVASLQRLLECADEDGAHPTEIPGAAGKDVVKVDTDLSTFFVHRDDDGDSRLIVVYPQDRSVDTKAALQRVHRVALHAADRTVRVNPAWSVYHHDNFVAFFAFPESQNVDSARWIAEFGPDASQDICFYVLTDSAKPVRLDVYKPPRNEYRQARADWPKVVADATRSMPTDDSKATVQGSIDLAATTFGAVTQYRTYSAWLEHLTPKQREFVEWPADKAVKLRGPAGSGKTLALELKLLRELYSARDQGIPTRILFATHSWAVAEQADSALRGLDETADLSGIDVFPFLEVARTYLPSEAKAVADHRLLGEDSLSGRRQQLQRISDVLRAVVDGDWLAYRKTVSDSFRSRIEASPRSADWNSLVWDLMLEFSDVLAAQGILPGVNAERRYLSLGRSPWMMPLTNDSEKRLVLAVYSQYVSGLRAERLLSSDQLVTDFLNYLETFTWNIRRASEGYDLIFVDELHLFSEQERLALHYLTKSPSEFPRMFMALDPRQSPSEVYAEFAAQKTARGESGRADLDLGAVDSVELHTVHRFTPQLLALIQHIHRSYPALDLGDDWAFDTESLNSSASQGAVPRLFAHGSTSDEERGVVASVHDFASRARPDQTVGVVLLDAARIDDFRVALKGLSVVTIQSRDDVERLRYSRRSVILGAAEYFAGLQLDYVIIAGVPNAQTGVANLGYQRRRLLSLLYVAVSRATRHVDIHTNDEFGGVPEVLASAAKNGTLTRPSAI